jgi:hypothetical protein
VSVTPTELAEVGSGLANISSNRAGRPLATSN